MFKSHHTVSAGHGLRVTLKHILSPSLHTRDTDIKTNSYLHSALTTLDMLILQSIAVLATDNASENTNNGIYKDRFTDEMLDDQSHNVSIQNKYNSLHCLGSASR